MEFENKSLFEEATYLGFSTSYEWEIDEEDDEDLIVFCRGHESMGKHA